MSELRHPWWTVARFEFLRVIRRTDFVVSLVLMPLLSVGASVGANMLAERAAGAPAKLAFVSEVPGVTPKLAVLDTVKAVKIGRASCRERGWGAADGLGT